MPLLGVLGGPPKGPILGVKGPFLGVKRAYLGGPQDPHYTLQIAHYRICGGI